jgi:hypothetical protein
MEKSSETTLVAYCYKGGACGIKFTRSGHEVLWDDRVEPIGYLSPLDERSADQVSDACRDNLIRYAASRQRPLIGNAARWRYNL